MSYRVKTFRYWLIVVLLAAVTVVLFRFTVAHGWTVIGILGLAATLVAFALVLSFGLSMRDRARGGPPVAR